MKTIFIAITCAVFLGSGGVLTCTELSLNSDSSSERQLLESFLKTAKVMSVDKGKGRRSELWYIDLDDGQDLRKGAFKITDRDWTSANGGNSYKYVLAAYELNKILDLNLIPPTVGRKINRRKGSLMLFVDQPFISEGDRRQKGIEPPDAEEFEKALAEVRIFEHLILFSCICNQRDLDNILIQTDGDWKIWMIDLDEAFAPATRLIRGCEITCCTKELFQKILDLKEEVVEARLKPYLSEEELNALIVRRNLIVERINELIAEKGEAAVLPIKKK
jgi:hypothetical protein